METEPVIYAESLFMDSGAYTLYAKQVLDNRGSKGQKLRAARAFTREADYSYYSLKPGSEFRAYCDHYAAFCHKVAGTDILLANVDAIRNPKLTWEIHEFFEKEHGLRLIPVIHSLTPFDYLARYMQKGYDLVGVGGPGRGVTTERYIMWADELFQFICPRSNGYLPLVRTHGFAMTSWRLLCRYPWWSVDSATWVKLAAYGWLYLPRWSEQRGWRYDKPPIQMGTSHKSAHRGKKDRHLDNVTNSMKTLVARWLDHCQVAEGSVDAEGNPKEHGVRTHFTARSRCNLIYFKGLEGSRPKYPYPLDLKKVCPINSAHRKGFAL